MSLAKYEMQEGAPYSNQGHRNKLEYIDDTKDNRQTSMGRIRMEVFNINIIS